VPRTCSQQTRGEDQHQTVEEDVLAVPESMPPPLGATAEQFLRTDGCPQCVTNVVMPYRIAIEDHGFTAYYHCRPCRHHWWTSWGS
jgi:DNA-directed RNA polymerase subunit M/transcription elongation factor TFIIS